MNSPKGLGVVVRLESSLKGFVVTRILITLSDAKVARDDDSLRPGEHAAALDLSLEWVVIGPHLKMVCADLLRSHFFDEDCVLTLVAAPPDIVALDIGAREPTPYSVRLTGSSVAPVPLVGEFFDLAYLLLHDLEKVITLCQLFEFFKRHKTVFDGLE